MKKMQATEYMYASARIRALENRLVGRERMEVLIDARSADEVMDRLAEYGYAPAEEAEGNTAMGAALAGEARSRAREGMLLAILREAYREVEAAVPDPAVFRYFRYPYDCNNLKAAIKCHIRGISAEDMLFDFGTVPADEVEEAVREGKTEVFPPAMAAAALRAREAYDKSGDPRMIDAILDRACYEDMLRDALESGDSTLIGWVRAKIDLTNLMLCLRILRMGQGSVGASFLADTLLTGGTLPEAFFTAAYEAGESGFWDALSSTPYYALTHVEGDPRPLSAVEKAADDLYMELVREGARVPFGASVAGGYLIGCETAVKNIRIVLASKDAELAHEVIRERIRVSYV